MHNYLSRTELLIALGFSVLTDQVDVDRPIIDLSYCSAPGDLPTANPLCIVADPDSTLRDAMSHLCAGDKVAAREMTDIIIPLRQAIHPYALLCKGFTHMAAA